jgi:hypothetical protein
MQQNLGCGIGRAKENTNSPQQWTSWRFRHACGMYGIGEIEVREEQRCNISTSCITPGRQWQSPSHRPNTLRNERPRTPTAPTGNPYLWRVKHFHAFRYSPASSRNSPEPSMASPWHILAVRPGTWIHFCHLGVRRPAMHVPGNDVEIKNMASLSMYLPTGTGSTATSRTAVAEKVMTSYGRFFGRRGIFDRGRRIAAKKTGWFEPGLVFLPC